VIREINGRLYAVTRADGRQKSRPIADVEADATRLLANSAAHIQQHQQAADQARAKLREALLAGDQSASRKHQQSLDKALQAVADAKARETGATAQLAECRNARIRQRAQRIDAEADAEVEALLAKHPVPEINFTLPPEHAA